MSRPAYLRSAIAVCATILACSALLASLNTPPAGAAETSQAGASLVTHVSIVDFAFSPASITVPVGSSVRWTHNGLFPHTTTSDPGSLDAWDSGTLGVGDAFTKTYLFSVKMYPVGAGLRP
jgi:plastocyanin